jgi:AcrR family transcriptional regulator
MAARDKHAPVAKRPGRSLTKAQVHEAAITLFAEKGYHGTTLRDIGAALSVQAGSLYNHISSKEELLFELLTESVQYRIDSLRAAIKDIDDPVERFRVAIDVSIMSRPEKHREVFVAQSELRALDKPKRAAVIAVRDEYEELLGSILEYGVRRGAFVIGDQKLTVYAIIAVVQQIGQWFTPGGRLSLQQVSEIYQDMFLSSLLHPVSRGNDRG